MKVNCTNLSPIHKGGVIIVILVVLFGLIITDQWYGEEKEEEEEEQKPYQICSYSVMIKLKHPEYYRIRIPVVVYGKNTTTIHEVMNNLTIKEGTANFTIVNTTKGPALEISGQENLWVRNYIKQSPDEDGFFPTLSLTNKTLIHAYDSGIYNYSIFLDSLSSSNWINLSIDLKILGDSLNDPTYSYVLGCTLQVPEEEKYVRGKYGIMIS